jgi:signal transduction histidine kinase
VSRRILAAVLVVTAVSIAAFFVPAALAIRSAQERGELLELQREASIVASRVPPVGPIDDTVLQPVPGSRHRLGLYGPDGRLLDGFGPEQADRIVAVALAGNFAEGRVGDDLVAAVPVRALVDGSSLVMRIEAPRSDSRSRYLRSIAELAAAAVVVLVAAGAIGAWVARRLNRPIDELRRWAAGTDPGSEPPPATGIDELDSLRADLIEDRERIAELLRRERSFSSDVSHQLRTPVAAMRVAIETEREAPRPDPADVLEEALGQLDRLESTISSLLTLARHHDRPPAPVDLGRIVGDRSEAWRAMSSALDRCVVVSGPSTTVTTDADAVGHIVDVLVDNALRHGSGVVEVVVGAADGYATIDVADQGPRPAGGGLFEGARSDAGHGIGLQLARSLAASVGGRLALLDRATTTVRLSLPADA